MSKNSNAITPFLFCQYDPLARLLLHLSKQKLYFVLLLYIIIYGLLFLGLGIFISNYYFDRGEIFVGILDPREIPSIIYQGGLFIPVIWLYYVWQLISISKNFNMFIINELISDKEVLKYYNFLKNKVYKIFNKRSYALIATISFIALSIFWIQGIGQGSSDPFSYGLGKKWWNVNEFYFYLIWLPFALVTVYMIFMILVRHICFAISLNSLYKEITVVLKLFHPDKCNGIEFIGGSTIRLSLISIVFASNALYSVMYPQLFGQSANLDLPTLLYLIVYTVMAPTLPIVTIWSTHLFMTKNKHYNLEKIARKLRLLFSLDIPNNLRKSNSQIEDLEKRYSLLEKELKTWPVRSLTVTRYGFSISSPIIGAAISILFDIIKNRG